MLEIELIELINDIQLKKCELQTLELKKAKDGCPKKLYDTLSAFSNQSGGGILLFGIEEQNSYAVCGVYDAQDLQKTVAEQCSQMQPIVRPLFTVAHFKGNLVVSAEIQECDVFEKPCFYKGAGRMKGSYIRVGDFDMPMTEYEVYSYEVFKRKIHDELTQVPRCTLEMLDSNKLANFYTHIQTQKPNLAYLPKEQILELQGITLGHIPTVTGLMLFGLYPQAYFPQLSIIAVVVPGYELGELGELGERFIDNKRIEGTLPQLLEQALQFILRNIQYKTIIHPTTGKREDRYEYPLLAIREILLNALVHRDYSVHTENSPIRIMLFKNRLEVENPGGLYGRLTLDSLGKISGDTRNPYMANILEVLGETENRFSGIPTIYKEMEKYNLPQPEFMNQRGNFKAILRNTYTPQSLTNFTNKTNTTQNIINFCNVPRTREELATFLNIQTPSYAIKNYIQPLLEQGLLKMLIPDKPKSKNQKYVAVL